MKRILLFFIVISLVSSFTSCQKDTPRDMFRDFMTAVSDADAETVCSYIDSGSSLERYRDLMLHADSESINLIRKIYSKYSYVIISDNVEAENAGKDTVISDINNRTMRIKLTYIDLAAVRSVCMSEVATGSSMSMPSQTVSALIEDGTIDRYLLTKEIDVKFVKEDGVWKLPLSIINNKELNDAFLFTFVSWILG